MGRYIRKRLLQAVPVVFGITILTFFIMKMAPGGPLTGMISPRTSSESLQRAREALLPHCPVLELVKAAGTGKFWLQYL